MGRIVLLLSLALTACSSIQHFDEEVAGIARSNQHYDAVFDAVEPFGGGHADKVIAGLAVYGFLRHDQRAKNTALDAFVSSMIASKAITPLLKQTFDRTRPNGGDESFPSNHATQAFAVATAISMHYHERWPYAIATGVGLARIYHDAHWTSDVLAGAAIGTFIAQGVVKTNERWRVTPIVDRKRVGVVVAMSR